MSPVELRVRVEVHEDVSRGAESDLRAVGRRREADGRRIHYPGLLPAFIGRALHVSSLGVLPHDEQPHGLREPLQRRFALIREGEGLARAQLPHHVRHQHLPRLRAVADARRELHGRAEVVVVFRDRLARIQTDAHANFAARQVALDLQGRLHGRHRGPEGGEDAVPGVLDLLALVGRQGGADGVVVAVQDLLGFGVAEGLRERGGGFQVGEEEGAEGRGVAGRGRGRAPRSHPASRRPG